MKFRHILILLVLSLVVAPVTFAAGTAATSDPAESIEALDAVEAAPAAKVESAACGGDLPSEVALLMAGPESIIAPEDHCSAGGGFHVSDCSTQCQGCFCQQVQGCCYCS